jgi:hypothetical protein
MTREGETIHKIRELVRVGRVGQPFTADDINDALGIHWAGTFLPKHRVGNPGRNSELFVQMERGQYRLK